jgi:DNA-binding transcriptional ArsR family regulator
VTVPSLSDTVKRTCDALRQGATKQVTDYEQRFSSIKTIYDDLLANLIRAGFDPKDAYETAWEFFGGTTVRFAGVDGTMYSRPLFDMVIFFGGAYAATGSIRFSDKAEPEVRYDERTLERSMGISSVVPIYINEIPDMDASYAAQEQPGEVNPAKPMTDEEIANNSLIANAIMTFSEYFLAYKLAADPAQDMRIILLDRSLSTERASLLYETRKTNFWNAKTTLVGCKASGDDNPIDKNDIIIARQHVSNVALGLPPPRSDYLRTAIICMLEQNRALTADQIAAAFGATDEKRIRRIEGALKRLTEREILIEENGAYWIALKYATSWERIKRLTLEIGDRLFFTKTLGAETSSSMKIVKDDKEHWLTTLDIAFLTLFTLQMLMEECWKKHILLIGVTKDTAARDFKRQLVPIMYTEGLLKTGVKLEALRALPNTDRMILQSASIFNVEQIAPPWSLIEYDSAFRTMLPDRQNRRGYVSGAIRNKISLEKAFVKTYVQLSQARTDPLLRSNVLLVDRLVYPEYDCKPESLKTFWNELSDGTREPVETVLYADRAVTNRLQNLMMSVLVSMAPTNIPEAFGHNKALFIADKIAKWNYSQFRCVVDTTATWILNNHKLRKFIFYMSTFRERRSQIEQTRRESH